MPELVNPKDITIEPVQRWKLTEEQRDDLNGDLAACMEYNPAPFGLLDIASMQMLVEGELDGLEWEWDVVLKDGRKYHIVGGCDYTGWDCQSWASYTEVVS